MRAVPLLAALLAACAATPEEAIRDLEARAVATPRADLDALLRGPPAPHPLRRAEAATLPLMDGTLPIVEARVNGRLLPCILDTGASVSSFSGPGAVAAELYLPPGPTLDIVAPGHLRRARVAVLDELRLGPARLGPGLATVALEDTFAGRWSGIDDPAYGILGCTALGHFRLEFDFRKRVVRLTPHGKGGRVRPLFVPVTVGGRPYRFLVDSGASRTFLEPWVAAELGLVSEAKAARLAEKSTRIAARRVAWVRVPSLAVAGREFGEVEVGVVGTFGDERIGGLLGLQGFGRLVWTVDFGERRLTVRG